jgi:hypothetical protein
MADTREEHVVVEDAKYHVALEVYARNIVAHSMVGEADTETQPAVFRIKGQKMDQDRTTLEAREFFGDYVHVLKSMPE